MLVISSSPHYLAAENENETAMASLDEAARCIY
jgi:hypothetical protein